MSSDRNIPHRNLLYWKEKNISKIANAWLEEERIAQGAFNEWLHSIVKLYGIWRRKNY